MAIGGQAVASSTGISNTSETVRAGTWEDDEPRAKTGEKRSFGVKLEPGFDAREKIVASESLLYPNSQGLLLSSPPFLGSSLGDNPQLQRMSGEEWVAVRA